MKNRNFIYSLLSVSLAVLLSLSVTGKVWAWGATGSDGGNYQALQETAVFFNNSGSIFKVGKVVILDTFQSGVVTATTLGSYVKLPEPGAGGGQADSVLTVGVVKSVSVADQLPVVVVTKGPVNTTCDDSTDAVSNSTAVGTTGHTAGRCGGGTNLGIALEAGAGNDGDTIRIWVDPTGGD